MLFKSQNIINDNHFALSLITTDVKYGSFLNFNDDAKASEKIFAFILSRLFKCDFEECDLMFQHYPAIDLSSEDIAVQVSAQDTPNKIRDSITKFKEHVNKGTYDKKFKKIVFLIISHKTGFRADTFNDIDTAGLFNPKEDIIFTTQLGRLLAKLSDSAQIEIRDFLWNELKLESNYNSNRFKFISSLDKELNNAQNIIKPKTTQLEFDNDLLFYNQDEINLIEDFEAIINFENSIPYLITGHPSSGKTTTAIKIARNLKDKLGALPFYVRVNQQTEYSAIFDDLVLIEKRPSILIVDDIHLNFDLANRIIKENTDFKNIIFIFVSRYISTEYRLNYDSDDIFKELSKLTLSLEKLNSPNFHREKIEGIVDKYALYLKSLGLNPRKGGILHLESISNKNLLKLKLLLGIWCKDEDVISNIQDKTLNITLFNKYLANLSPNEIENVIVYATIYSFDIPFEKLQATRRLDSEKEGLFYTEEMKSIFMQPSFCDLLIDAYLYKEQRLFNNNFNNDRNLFKFSKIKKYIQEYLVGSYQEYPDFIADIYVNIGSLDNHQIFNMLLNDTVTYQPLIKYFSSSSKANSSQIKRIIQITKIISTSNLDRIIEDLIIKNKSALQVFTNDKTGLLVLSYVHFSISESNKFLKDKLYSRFSDEEIKIIIENTSPNIVPLAIQYLNDKNKRTRVLSLFSIEFWQTLINQIPFDLLGNTLTELRNISPSIANTIFNSLDVKNIASSIRYIHFYKFTKNLSELKTFEKNKVDSKAKQILNSVESWRVKKAIEHRKTTIQHIASGFAQLAKIDDTFLSLLLEDFSANILYEKLKEIKFLDEYGLMLVNISKASNSFSSKIIELIDKEHYFKSRFNSAGIKGREIASILQALYKVGDRDYGKKLIKDTNYDILEGRVISSTPDVSTFIIRSIQLYDLSVAKKLLSVFLNQNIIEKIDNKNFDLSNITSMLVNINACNPDVCYEFFNDIENIIFVRKSLKGTVTFHDIATFLSNVKDCNPEKTEDLYTNIYAHDVFHRKLREETLEQFVKSLNSLSYIRLDYTIKLINSYVNQKGITKDRILQQIKTDCKKLWKEMER
ncbi:MAG: SMEK domain-containing protein [Bacteroidetes bacterium]|nr:SMEK domain-containing protein [Bacteroidota bacterium]